MISLWRCCCFPRSKTNVYRDIFITCSNLREHFAIKFSLRQENVQLKTVKSSYVRLSDSIFSIPWHVTHDMRAWWCFAVQDLGLQGRFMDGISCSCHNKLQPLPSDWGAFLHHDWPDTIFLYDWQTYVCHLWSPLHPHPHPSHLLVETPCCHNLSHGLYPCLCPCSHIWPPCPAACCSRTRRRTTKQCSPVRRGVLGGPILSR